MSYCNCSYCQSDPCHCSDDHENTNRIENNPTNTNTFNPIIQIPSPANGRQGGLLTEFDVDQPPVGPVTLIPATDDGIVLCTVQLAIDDFISDRVWLNGTVEWAASQGTPTVVLFITRQRPGGTEATIFTTSDEGDAATTDEITTSFTFVDETPIVTGGQQLVVYRLKARSAIDAEEAILRGNTFTAAEIRANNP
ncbi:hypothetical protein ACFSCZ_08735 [Siminovitchia sediminis]|uniref:Uncharacterized protein n=1 Tax=Siminovitchia sediminis TaxID=1274353 RepID=A0ABW4KGI1_9BACI